MVVRRPKKRRRGERTYHGSHKKWRGGGSRGGRGKAGMHKHKWSYTVKYEPDHFGKRGFKPPYRKRYKTINLKDLDKLVLELQAQGKLQMEGGIPKINLLEFGYEKLLGSGKITQPIIVEAKKVSRKAKEKIMEMGGKVVEI